MFIGIDSQFKEGEIRKAKLTFEKAGTIELDFQVENVGAMKMDGTGKMDHGKMGQGKMKQGG